MLEMARLKQLPFSLVLFFTLVPFQVQGFHQCDLEFLSQTSPGRIPRTIPEAICMAPNVQCGPNPTYRVRILDLQSILVQIQNTFCKTVPPRSACIRITYVEEELKEM